MPFKFFGSNQNSKMLLKILNVFPNFIFTKPPIDSLRIMGIDFPNRIGVAAGFDNKGDNIKSISNLGFGHIEVGPVTIASQKHANLNKKNISVYPKDC